MYGEDDFKLGEKEKLPMVQLLDASAHYNGNAPEFLRGEYIKKAEKAIKADLETRDLLFDNVLLDFACLPCLPAGRRRQARRIKNDDNNCDDGKKRKFTVRAPSRTYIDYNKKDSPCTIDKYGVWVYYGKHSSLIRLAMWS